MAAKKKQEKAQGVEIIPLDEMSAGIDLTSNRLVMRKSPLKRLWMTPDMKTVFCESKHPVTEKLLITKVNLDNFTVIEFYPDQGGEVIETSTAPAPEVSQDVSQ
jgi:hypothetical protein